MPDLIGYARVSTLEQGAGFEAQERDLRALGCHEIYSERVSSVAVRPQLEEAIRCLRRGDVFVVTKLDRLARSMRDLLNILSRIDARKASLRILDMSLDTNTPTGKLMINMLGSVAQFEREVMLERQREGIAKAKADGRYKGRAPTPAAVRTRVHELRAAGTRAEDIATGLKLSRATVFRVLAERAGV